MYRTLVNGASACANRAWGGYQSVERFFLRQNNCIGTVARTAKAASLVAWNVLSRQGKSSTSAALQAGAANAEHAAIVYIVQPAFATMSQMSWTKLGDYAIRISEGTLAILVINELIKQGRGIPTDESLIPQLDANDGFVGKELTKGAVGAIVDNSVAQFPGGQVLLSSVVFFARIRHPLMKDVQNVWFNLCVNNIARWACGPVVGFVVTPLITASYSAFRQEYKDAGSFTRLCSNLAESFRTEKAALDAALQPS